MSGRPPSKEPAKLYDYRRMKALVDVIAEFKPDSTELAEALEALCAGWGVQPIWDKDGNLNTTKTIHVLARYTQKHGKNETLDKQSKK